MKTNDLIKVVYTPEELEACNTNIAALDVFAGKYAPNLTADDRQAYGSINETNKLFVNKTKTLMEQNPSMVPVFINQEEYNRDLIAREEIEKFTGIDILKTDLDEIRKKLDMEKFKEHTASALVNEKVFDNH